MRQIFLDTETTGLHAQGGDRIIEIGCVELINRKRTGNNFHFYVNPERDSHADALAVHGITTEFLQDKPKFEAIATDLLTYLQGAELIIHNAEFDVGFLDMELQRLGRGALREHVARILDSLAMAKEMFPGKRNGLNALCDRFGVDKSERTLHGALLDAELLADVYIHLTRGQDALLMDIATPSHADAALTRLDMRNVALPVVLANAQEMAAHEMLMKEIDQASGGKTVSWAA